MNAAPQWVISTVFSEQLTKHDAINLPALRLDINRAVATAKIAEFENQSYRIGHVVRTGLLGRAAAADSLLEVAVANGLVHEHGDDTIQSIIANGLDWK
jgi:hypothetical protein